MEKYNYREQVKSDILDYIAENEIKVTASNREEVAEQLQDELWANDSVTGNASGSYTCNAWKAEENICHNLDLLKEALEEFGPNIADLDSAEMCDVTIRCYLLGECIHAALDEVEEEDDAAQDFTGWKVLNRGDYVGTVTDCEPIPGNLCLYLKPAEDADEIIIPLHEDLIISIDEDALTLNLNLPDGLL